MNHTPLKDRAIAIVGEETWGKLTDQQRKSMLFDTLCPAGGKPEQEYHEDGQRYWERQQKKSGTKNPER